MKNVSAESNLRKYMNSYTITETERYTTLTKNFARNNVNEKFELHFLVENSDVIGKVDLWYLTISGTEIIDINP